MTLINTGADAGQKTGPDADSLDPMSRDHAHAHPRDVYPDTPGRVGRRTAIEAATKLWGWRNDPATLSFHRGLMELVVDRLAMVDVLPADAEPDAVKWLEGYDPRDGLGVIGETSEHHQFGRDIVLAAFAAGRDAGEAKAMIPMRGAVALLTEGARVFRQYEAHHRDQMGEERSAHGHPAAGRADKVKRNADLAQRFEDFLQLDTTPRDRLAGLALSLCQDLDALMGDSVGVAGLHQNGEIADWPTLRRGGQYEDWLKSFDTLIEALEGVFPPQESHPGWPEPGDQVTVRHEGVDYTGVVERPSFDADESIPKFSGGVALRPMGETVIGVFVPGASLPMHTTQQVFAVVRHADTSVPPEIAMVNASARPGEEPDPFFLNAALQDRKQARVEGKVFEDDDADPAAAVRTIEAAVAGGLIPGISTARLSTARVEARLFRPQAVPGVYSPEQGQPSEGLDPEVVAALRQAHDGAE